MSLNRENLDISAHSTDRFLLTCSLLCRPDVGARSLFGTKKTMDPLLFQTMGVAQCVDQLKTHHSMICILNNNAFHLLGIFLFLAMFLSR